MEMIYCKAADSSIYLGPRPSVCIPAINRFGFKNLGKIHDDFCSGDGPG
jgi:hypothetical protein